MRTMWILLADASLAMALFWAVYHFSLRKVALFKANRMYLLVALLLSLLLPLFPIQYTVIVENGITDAAANSQTGMQILASGEGIKSAGGFLNEKLMLFLLWAYLGGVLLVLARLAVQTAMLINVIYQSGISRHGHFRIISNSRYPLPFSFFGYVFYNPAVYGGEELADILAHEDVHIREKHWADLLLAELFTAVFWFNPFVWLLERSIRQNHEYLADEGVLAQGHPRGRYQALLINQLMGVPVMGFTHPLHYSMNANRFKMMTLKEKPKKRALRLMWALPVVALLSVAFAEPVFETQAASQEKFVSPADAALSPSGDFKVTGKVVKPDGTPLHGASVVIGGSTTGTMSGADGMFELLISGKDEVTLYISFVGYQTATQKISGGEPSNLHIMMKEQLFVLTAEPSKSAVPPPPPPPPPASRGKSIVPPPPPPPPPSEAAWEKAAKSMDTKNNKVSGEEEVFIMVESLPEYPEGQAGLDQLASAVRYRLKGEGTLSGKAKVEFTVNEKGIAVNPIVREQSNEAAGKAALTTVREMKPWKPGTQRGQPVPVKYILELVF